VRCWGADSDGIREVGAGIIDQIEIVPGDVTMLRVSGDDLLRDLAMRTVGDLELYQAVQYTPYMRLQYTLSDGTFYTTDITAPVTIDMSPSNPRVRFFLGYPRQFSKVILTLSTVNNVLTDTMQIEYYNGSQADRDELLWERLGSLTNNTAALGPDPSEDPEQVYPFGVAGTHTIEFDIPSGWSPFGGYYYIRFVDERADLSEFRITYAAVSIIEPVSDGLQRIMALAPPGWSLDPAGQYATSVPVYMRFSGESVLGALIALREQTGEHFTRSPAGRRVWWLGNSQVDSGVRAVQASEPGDNIMLITGLQRSADSYDLYTRAYGYSAGNGSERLTMAKTTRSEAGYTLGPGGAYLEADAAVSVYGRIDHYEDFTNIAPADSSEAQIIHAANALYDQVYHALRRQSELQYAYSLEVVPSRYTVWPGQKLRVVYHEWVEGFHAVDIDALLWVISTTTRITPAGLEMVALQVATVDYAPDNDARALAKMMQSIGQTRGAELPPTRLSSARPGVPVGLDVRNGKTTAIARIAPIPDGWYQLNQIGKIRVLRGLITKIEATVTT
jgi:hypothetical protein